MDWISAASLAIKAFSGTSIKTSAASNFAGSGFGAFKPENNLSGGAMIDLTKPDNFAIGALLAFTTGILLKKVI